ncbi:hypothetical protein LZ023_35570 (plasmid) [Pseudomonas silvicola]|nr:hypothetical protein LZ023_35570 [Pseudomonas silvicola]
MKPSAWLINTARGGLINETELALRAASGCDCRCSAGCAQQ